MESAYPPYSGYTFANTGGGGGGGAPVGAQYLTLALDGTLTGERVFSPSANFLVVDGGAGGNYSLDLANTAVAAGAYTYASVTVDAKGRITSAASGAAPVTAVNVDAGELTTTGGTTPSLGLAAAGTAGTYAYPASVTTDGFGRVTAVTAGTVPAPVGAQYLVLSADATLTSERRFVAGTGLTAVDGGAGGDYTLNASPGTPAITVVATTPYAASAATFLVVKPSAATIVINLPAGVLDASIIVKHGNASLFDVQVNANGADTIDGQASYLLTTRQSLTLTFEGGVWHSR